MLAPFFAALVATFLQASVPTENRFEFRRAQMGTQFRVVLYAESEVRASRAAELALDRVAEIESVLSDYRSDSELSQVQARLASLPPGDAVAVSPDLQAAARRGIEVAAATGGAFDITVGPLVRLWRQARTDGKLPSESELASAQLRSGFWNLRADHRLRFLVPGMSLDFGGIGKGYAVEEAARVLRAEGISRFLVAGSGDIRLGESPPGASGWKVGIVDTGNPRAEPGAFVELKDVAISTSGDTEQFVEIEGLRYSHVVDPRSGLGTRTGYLATVIASDGATADALATAATVLDPERSLQIARGFRGVQLRVTARTGPSGEPAAWRTKGFPRMQFRPRSVR
ncbi:MAG TPA: FAD:protein FMN transferase [Bdellovibrionota bacterium]|nr:FAD:protein FMN transferase [Bdellovibrionota bacterium]